MERHAAPPAPAAAAGSMDGSSSSRHSAAAIAERRRLAMAAAAATAPSSSAASSSSSQQQSAHPHRPRPRLASPSPSPVATPSPRPTPSPAPHTASPPLSTPSPAIVSPFGSDPAATTVGGDVSFPTSATSSLALADSYLALGDPSALVSTLPNSSSFDETGAHPRMLEEEDDTGTNDDEFAHGRGSSVGSVVDDPMATSMLGLEADVENEPEARAIVLTTPADTPTTHAYPNHHHQYQQQQQRRVPRYAEIDDDPPVLSPSTSDSSTASTHSAAAAGSSLPVKKDSHAQRFANFFKRDTNNKKKKADASTTDTASAASAASPKLTKAKTDSRLITFPDTGSPKKSAPASAPTSSSNSLLNLLRSTSGSASSSSKKKKQQKQKKGSKKATAATAVSGEEDDDDGGSTSGGGGGGGGGGQKRSVYTQKLIHLSNTFLNIFSTSSSSSSPSSSQPASLLAFSHQSHTFTNSPAWILGRVYKLLGPLQAHQQHQQPHHQHQQHQAHPSHGVVHPHSEHVPASMSVHAAQLSALHLRRHRFLSDFTSQVWCTYRRGFPTIATSVYSSDAGWGCMIRSAQMMLAQVFVRHYLGREWRRPERLTATTTTTTPATSHPKSSTAALDSEGDDPESSIDPSAPSATASNESSPLLAQLPSAYLRILSLFLDSPSPLSPYSIHNLLHNGQSSRDKKVGEWFGPHNACWMVKMCLEGELAKVQRKMADGRRIEPFDAPMEEGGFGSDSAPNEQASRSSRNAHSAAASASSSSSVPPEFSVPKIYVSDDGTLYLDKIMQLVRVGRGDEEGAEPAAAAATGGGASRLGGGDEAKVDHESSSSKPRTYSNSHGERHSSSAGGSSSSSSSSSPSVPHPPHFSPDFHPLMILIPLRLGVDKLNVGYIPSLLSLFQFPQCIGIIGGKPRTSLYFIGVQDQQLFYLDPHTVQKSVDLTGAHSLRGTLAARHAIADTYHCSSVLSLPVTSIDPSLAIGFYLENQSALDEFWEQARKLTDAAHLQAHSASSGYAASSPNPAAPLLPVFHVADISPNFAAFDEESDGDDDDAGSEGSGGASASDTSEVDFDVARRQRPAAGTGVGDSDDGDDDDGGGLGSPAVPIHTSSLPRGPDGKLLNVDSLTSSPVLCATAGGAAVAVVPDASLLDESTLANDDSLILPPTSTAAEGAAPSSSASSSGVAATAHSSVAALTDLTYAFSAAAATRLSSTAKGLSDFASSAASQASASLAAAQAAAQRKMSRDPPEGSPPSQRTGKSAYDQEEDGTDLGREMVSMVLVPVPPPTPPPAATDGMEEGDTVTSPVHVAKPTTPMRAQATTVPAAAAPAASAGASSTRPTPARKSSKGKPRSSNRRRGSDAKKAGSGDDEWSFL